MAASGDAADDMVATLQSLASDLMESTETYKPSLGQDGLKSRMDIMSKAKQITSLLTHPMEEPFNQSANMAELLALRTLMKMHVFENIPSDGTISVPNLAQKTGAQESLLARLLRLMAAMGVLKQTEDDHYAHTQPSMVYLTIGGTFFQVMFDEFLCPMTKLPDYLEKFGFEEPTSQTENPMSWYEGQMGKTAWEILSQKPERLEAFNRSMQTQDEVLPIVGIYDFGQLGAKVGEAERAILVDVGGGRGQAIKRMLETHSELQPSKMVLQDRPPVIEEAEKANELQGVVKMGHDFFDAQPVKGAAAYYIHRCLHDWSDKECSMILKRLADAMKPDSRVLIAEMVVPSHCKEADVPAAWMDLTMMVVGGKERTEENWQQLLSSAGLKIAKIWRAPVGPQAVIEAHLADS